MSSLDECLRGLIVPGAMWTVRKAAILTLEGRWKGVGFSTIARIKSGLDSKRNGNVNTATTDMWAANSSPGVWE